MAELPPFTDRELRFVRELVGHQVPFFDVGLSAAALQGAPVVTQDVDLWFRSLEDPPPMLAGEGLELFDIVLQMSGLRILASKRAADRPKDRAVVPVLEEVVALQAARQGSAR